MWPGRAHNSQKRVQVPHAERRKNLATGTGLKSTRLEFDFKRERNRDIAKDPKMRSQ